MTADWVPFHRRLAKGPKKSIPRGIRFVLLELSLEARATRGIIDLPVDWDTLDALHDLLGGDRREIKKALQIFSFRDSAGVSAIEIIKDATRHQCVITKWEEWAGPRTNAERQAEFKRNKKLREGQRYQQVTEVTPTGHNITEQDNTLIGGASAPVPKRARGSQIDPEWKPTDVDRAFALQRGWSEQKVTEESARFRDFHLAKGTVSKSWPASWRTWVQNDARFSPPRSGKIAVQPAAKPGEYDWMSKAGIR